MKTSSKFYKALVIVFLLCTFSFITTACGSAENSIAGTWVDEDGDEMSFYEDGTCMNTPVRSHSNEAESYKIQEDGRLIFKLEYGNSSSYDLAESQEEALEDDDLYFLDGDTLILKKSLYTRE